MTTTLITTLAVIGGFWLVSLSLLGAVTLRVRYQRRKWTALCDAIERHPAGSALWAFQARPCGHLLYSRSLDAIDVEHIEFDHVIVCEVAERMIANRRDVA